MSSITASADVGVVSSTAWMRTVVATSSDAAGDRC